MSTEYSNLKVHLGFVGVLLTSVLWGIVITGIAGFQFPLMHFYKFNAVIISLLDSSLYWGLVIGGIFSGILVDTYGAGKVSIASLILIVLGGVIFVFGETAIVLESSRLIAGVGLSSAFPVGQKVIVENYPAERLPLFSGLCIAAYTFGSSIGIYGTLSLISILGFTEAKEAVVILSVIVLVYQTVFYRVNDGKNINKGMSLKKVFREQLEIIKNKHYILVVFANTLAG